MHNATKSLSDIQKQASDALRRSLTAPDTERTQLLRDTAALFVDARGHFFTAEGEPDWLGRTYAYRSWIRETTSMANVPGESKATIQAAIRYHSGNIIRERLDQGTLDSLGLVKSSPRERSIEKRERTSETVTLFSGGAEFESPEEVLQVCHLVEAALARVNAAMVASLPAKTRREVKAALREVAERAEELSDSGRA
jgi:hypothetical protein